MDQKLMNIAAEAISVPVESVPEHMKGVPEIDGWYVWNPVRGGLAVLINAKGEKLVATSSVSFKKHLEVFLSGRRN